MQLYLPLFSGNTLPIAIVLDFDYQGMITMRLRSVSAFAAICTIAFSAAAAAQETGRPTDAEAGRGGPPPGFGETVFSGDFAVAGLGGALSPSYTGSDDYNFSVLPVVTGSIGGVTITPRAAGVKVDFLPNSDRPVNFDAGVAVRIRGDRSDLDDVNDAIVEQYAELDTAVEVGPGVGFTVDSVLNPFDSVSVATAVMFDVTGSHEGYIVNPTVTYTTPLSRSMIANLSLGAEWADGNFHDYYFRSDPLDFTGPAGDALPAFDPDGGGFTSANATLLLAIDLDGDATNGGLGLIMIGGYSRLLGDAAATPFTNLRGTRDQFLGGVGLTYTFGL